MANMKITIIGGGSAYCPVFLSAFIEQAHTFDGCQLVLMDTDAHNLDIIYRLGKQMVEADGANIDVLKTLDRREAIDGADFVVTTYRPGRFQARALDEKIPLKYDIIGQETIGPGGFFMAFRSVHVVKELIKEIEEFAPSAILLNYTNPTNIVTEAILHHSQINTLGLCDQSQGDKRRLAHALEMDLSRLHYEACGLNHATWSTKFTIDDQDGMPIILERTPQLLKKPDISLPVKRMLQLAQWFERIPNRYWQYYYYHDEVVEEARNAKYSRAEEIMLELPVYFEHYEEESRKPFPNVVKMRGGSKAFGDFAVELIKAIVEDTNEVFILNVPNQSAIPGFDDDRVVEVPCTVNREGARPIQQPPLPHKVLGPIKILAEYQALTAQAVWEGDREDAIRALVANPLVLTINKAQRLVEEMISAHAAYLPERLIK